MDFSALNKKFANNFNNQKAVLKKLLKGGTVNCDTCNKPLNVALNNKDGEFIVSCESGCTQLTLEID